MTIIRGILTSGNVGAEPGYNTFSDPAQGIKTSDLLDFPGELPTGIGFEVVTANWLRSGATANASSDYFGWSQASWQYFFYLQSSQAGSLKLFGFTPGEQGVFRFQGHRNLDRTTQLDIGGNSIQYVSKVQPPNDFVEIQFTADGSGEVLLQFSPVDSAFCYCGAFEVEYPIASDPALLTPDTITGDGTSIPYTAIQASTTEPMRFQYSLDGYATFTERVLPTVNTDNSSGTFDLVAGAETNSQGALDGSADKIPYTVGSYEARLVIQNEAGDGDLFLDVTHQIKSGAYLLEYSSIVENGNDLLRPILNFIGSNDQIYYFDDQETGTPNITLGFNNPKSLPANAIAWNTDVAFEGQMNFAVWNTDTEKWIAFGVPVIPFGYGGLYVNSFLVGGAQSGPVGGNNPPDAHTIGFNTVESFPESIGTDGAFKWVINDAKDAGRSFLQYNLSANNPSLEVGSTYVFTVNVFSDASTVALGTSGISGITVANITTNAVAGQTVELKLELTVDSLGYAGQLRYGVGTTTNRSDRMEVFGAQLVKKDSPPPTGGAFDDAFDPAFN